MKSCYDVIYSEIFKIFPFIFVYFALRPCYSMPSISLPHLHDLMCSVWQEVIAQCSIYTHLVFTQPCLLISVSHTDTYTTHGSLAYLENMLRSNGLKPLESPKRWHEIWTQTYCWLYACMCVVFNWAKDT